MNTHLRLGRIHLSNLSQETYLGMVGALVGYLFTEPQNKLASPSMQGKLDLLPFSSDLLS